MKPPAVDTRETPPARRAGARGVSPVVARQIDENLKRLYRQQVEQELPPELAALVARLRDGETPTDDGGENSK